MKIPARDLQLADTIRLPFVSPVWNTAVVKQITDDAVHLFRPYVATADFSYTGGVICYIGIEEYQIYRNEQEYEVLERKCLK